MNGCTFGFHDWPKWSPAEEYIAVRVDKTSGREHTFKAYIQERTCNRCGLQQQNKVRPSNL